MDINADHISKEAKSPDGPCWADLRDRLPDHTPCTRGRGGQQLSHASAPGPRAALPTARGNRPGLPPHAPVPIHPHAELDSSGVTRRSPAPGGRGALSRSPGAPSARPTAAGEMSERGAMLVSHRLTCGPRRVSSSSATSALSQRASSRPTPRARASAPRGFRYSRAAR